MIDARDLQGRWRRDWLRAPGVEDRTTRVEWWQAGALFADIRVPADRPAPRGTCLAEQPPDLLLALMRAEAFAGHAEVADGVCTWHREVNWHGRPDGVDAGRMSFRDGALIEEGVHADYSERWRHEGAGLVARRVSLGPYGGVLVEDGARFLLVTGRAGAGPSAPLIAALEAGEVPDGLPAHFDPPCFMGALVEAGGRVDVSTNPFEEGEIGLLREGAALTVRWPDFHGRIQSERLRP